MGLFVYTQKGSIISMVDLPTTEIIEPKFPAKKTFSMLILKHSQRSISMSIKPENEQNQKQV